MSLRECRTAGWIALATAISTLLWVILMGVSDAATASPATLTEKIEIVRNDGLLYSVVYLNAGLLTLFGVLFMTAVYVYCRQSNPLWAALGVVFVPMYGLANLACYLSQVFLVPGLLRWHQQPEMSAVAAPLLALTIHTWPGSAVEAINGLAYALLGIPSIIFPLVGLRKPRVLAIGGYLLLASGVLSIIAFVGLLSLSGYLTNLSIVGGVVFLISLFPIACHFLRRSDLKKVPRQTPE